MREFPQCHLLITHSGVVNKKCVFLTADLTTPIHVRRTRFKFRNDSVSISQKNLIIMMHSILQYNRIAPVCTPPPAICLLWVDSLTTGVNWGIICLLGGEEGVFFPSSFPILNLLCFTLLPGL